MTRHLWSRGAAVAAMVFVLGVGKVQAVDYANIDVVDGAVAHVDAPTVTIPVGESTAGFNIDPGSVVGEIPIRIGASAADDADNGILIVSAREILRTPGGATTSVSATNSTVRDDDFSSLNTRNLSGGLAIVTDRAGDDALGANYPIGSAMNVNIAAAYFPFSQGWKGGTAYASVNNGAIDTFLGSAGISFDPTIGTANTANVRPNYFFAEPYDPGDAAKNGDHFVSIPGVTDSRQQGILLAMSAKNEDNFATVSPLADGEGWHVNSRGNSQDGPGNGESKPFSFVFVPLGTPNVTMGAIHGAAGQLNEPVTVLKGGSNFTIAKTLDGLSGTYRLTIDGQTPTSGTLFVQSGNNLGGSGGLPGDNIIPYKPDGDGWIITSDDMPNVNQGAANQNGASGERVPYFQFVFMPFNATPGTPTIQPAAWDKGSSFNFNVAVTQLTNGNDQDDVAPSVTPGPDMFTTVTGGTAGLDFVPSRMNKADNAVHINGALPTAADGVMLTTVSEGFRDNSATGGAAGFGIVSAGQTGTPSQWEVHTHTAALPAEEFNVNYSVSFFGRDSGFPMDNDVTTDASGNGHLDLTISGVNSESDGVLMLNSEGNAARFATAKPKLGGAGWDVDVKTTGLLEPGLTTVAPIEPIGAVNYVFLPYASENLVAGRVNANGSIVNSTGVGTNPGEFTLTKDATGQYLLTVAGKTPNDGTLLLTPDAGADAIADNYLVYEPAGNAFRISGLDLVTQAEKDGGAGITFEDTSFSFAFIDFAAPPEAPAGGNFLEADFNQNGVVDGNDLTAWKGGFGTGTTKAQGDADADGDVDGSDFLTWQRQLGTLPPATVAAGAVPEPQTAMLALLAGAALVGCGRRMS